MSPNTRTTTASARGEAAPKSRTAAPSRPTRTTAKAADETAQETPSEPARPTRVVRARPAVKPTTVPEGASTSRQTASTTRTASGKKSNTELGPSSTKCKPAPPRTIPKKNASLSTAASRKPTTNRAVSTAKPIVLQDAVSLTRDLQAALRDQGSSQSNNDTTVPSSAASKSPSGSELDVLGRYLSRALVLSDCDPGPPNASVTSTNSKTSGSPDSVEEAGSSTDAPSPTSEIRAISGKKQEIVLAKHVINAGLKTLLNIYHSGYRFPAPTGVPKSAEKKSDWKDVDVMKVVDACWQAFHTIDRLQPEMQSESRMETSIVPASDKAAMEGDLDIAAAREPVEDTVSRGDAKEAASARKAILEMEKIRTVLVSRCWMLGMFTKCLDLLSASQTHIMRLFNHGDNLPNIVSAATRCRGNVTTIPKRLPVKPAARIAGASPLSNQTRVLQEWTALLDFPIPPPSSNDSVSSGPDHTQELEKKSIAELDPTLKIVLIGRLVASWISISGVSAAAKNADIILQYLQERLNGCPTGTFGIVELAADSPETAKGQHIFQICVALNKVELVLPQLKQVVSFQTMKACTLAISAGEDNTDGTRASISFDKLWLALRSSCAKCITGAEREMDILRAVNEMIRTTVRIFVSNRDQADQDKGMAGSEWFSLLEFWMDLGRSLNDIQIVDEVSGYLDKRRQPVKRNDNDLENQMSSLSLGCEDALTAIRTAIVDFSRLSILLEQSSITPEACTALQSMPNHLQVIPRSLGSLPVEQYAETVTKLSRALRGLQHRIDKTSTRKTSKCDSLLEWDTAVDRWMLALGPCISDLLTNGLMVEVPVKYQVDLAIIAIQAAIDLSKRLVKTSDFSTHSTALGILDQARTLVAQSRATSDDKIEWMVLLSTSYYNRGVSLYLGELPVPALPFIERSADIVKEILQGSISAEDRKPELVAVLQELALQHSKRLELLAACYIKKGEKMAGFATYFACLMSQPQATIDQIIQTAETLPSSQTVKAFPAISTVLNRLASFLQKEALFFMHNFVEVDRRLSQYVLQDAYKGIILEYLVECLADTAHRHEVATLMRKICLSLTSIYTSDKFPVRRLRVEVRLMECNVNSGSDDWDVTRAEAVLDSANAELGTVKGHDQTLFKHKPQYIAQGHLHLALASHRSPNSKADFTSHAQQAVSVLTTLIPRPLTKTTDVNKVTKQKRAARHSLNLPPLSLDNPVKLDQQLDNLANNLGIFSHGLHRIEILRLQRGLQRHIPELKSAYVMTTSKLALEYARLGKHTRAAALFNVTRATMDKVEYRNGLSDNDLAEISLRYALYLAWAGDAEKSTEIYEQARRQYQAPQEKNAPSTTAKIRAKADVMNLAAMSNALLAEISIFKNDIAAATCHGAIAFRLWNRAVDNLARIAVKYRSQSKSPVQPQLIVDDPFMAARAPVDPQNAKALDEEQANRKMAASTAETRLSGNHLTYTWSLLESTLNLAQTHLTKGSAKQAEAYATQAYDLASELQAGIWKAKASSMLAAVYIKTESLEQAAKFLEEAQENLEKMNSSESAVCALWLNRLHTKNLQENEAEEAFQSLLTIIKNIEASLTEVERVASTPIKQSRAQSSSTSTADDSALSVIRVQGMRQRARQLRLAGNMAEGETLLEHCIAAESGHALSPEYKHIMGYLLMSKVLDNFKTDLFLNSVTESSISMPMGGFVTEGNTPEHRSPATVMSILVDAETAFEHFLVEREQTGNVEDVRDAVMSLASLKVYQSSLGQSSSALTYDTVDLLDKSCALTLHREMLELLDSKRYGKSDELIWPPADLRLALVPGAESARVTDGDSSDSAISPQDKDKEDVALLRRFDCFNRMEENTGETLTQTLPDGWSVVTINLTDDQNTLFVSRQQVNREPIVFAIALNRQSKKEEDEDEQFTFETATNELRNIIQTSDETARNAKNIDTREGRIEWWNTRKALDKRLETLLHEIEYAWLGAFKTILNPVDGSSPASLSTFKSSLERIFRNALSRQDKAKVNRVRLQTSIVECFSSLSCKSDEQEIEDLVYYLLDLYLYNGVPVALAELDIEQLIIDVQSALSTFESDRRTESISPQPEEHIFLILDKHVQEIPWESLPVLRGRAISRIPSARFLFDRLASDMPSQPSHSPGEYAVHQKHSVNVSNTCFIMNAAGDLKQTQGRFGCWLNDMTESKGWKGIVNRHPTELELATLLERHELLLYFGHGGMEQYIRSQKIRNLKTCATTMLWGCSSGILKYMGELDRTGTPHNYMLAGCPSLTAMLWDVTDKDIDKMAEAVMQDLGLMPSPAEGDVVLSNQTSKSRSIAQAVGAARDQCKLKYLTGAAAVTYGIPVYFH